MQNCPTNYTRNNQKPPQTKKQKVNSLCVFFLVFLSFFSISVFSGQPNITGFSNFSASEQDPAAIIDTDISFTNGINYTNGFVRFSITNPDPLDQLVLSNSSDVNASGAISLIGSNVYLGNGSGRDRIGYIDSTENGRNGRALKINLSKILNAGFETGDMTGWTSYEQEFTGNSYGQAIPYIYGCSPACTTGTGTLNISAISAMSYTTSIDSATVYSGSYSLRLYLSGNITQYGGGGGQQPDGYGSSHGPYVESSSFEAANGDSIYLEWSAQNGGDWYESFGFLVGSGGDGSFSDGNETTTLLFSQLMAVAMVMAMVMVSLIPISLMWLLFRPVKEVPGPPLKMSMDIIYHRSA